MKVLDVGASAAGLCTSTGVQMPEGASRLQGHPLVCKRATIRSHLIDECCAWYHTAARCAVHRSKFANCFSARRTTLLASHHSAKCLELELLRPVSQQHVCIHIISQHPCGPHASAHATFASAYCATCFSGLLSHTIHNLHCTSPRLSLMMQPHSHQRRTHNGAISWHIPCQATHRYISSRNRAEAHLRVHPNSKITKYGGCQGLLCSGAN